MAEASAEGLASKLIKENAHLASFEVNPNDPKVANLLAKSLEAQGCKVVRTPFSTLLTVTCPDAKA